MGPISTGENSNEAVIVAVTCTRMPLRMRRHIGAWPDHNRRHTTDKYWCGLFVVVLITWTVSRQYVIHHQTFDVATENITVTNKIPEFISKGTDRYVAKNASVAKNIFEFSDHDFNETNHVHDTSTKKETPTFIETSIETLHTIFYVSTCNLSHMNGRKEYGPYTMGSIYCFVGSLLVLRFNRILRRQPSVVGVVFVYVALLEHLSITLFSNDSVASVPFHEKLSLWIMPEVLFLIIWLSKMFSEIHHKNSKNFRVRRVSRSSDENLDRGKAKDEFDFKNFRFYHCINTILLSFPFIVTIKYLMNCAVSVAYKIGWNNVHPYIIVGGSYYLGLTVYYFGLTVTSCTFAIARKTKSQSICNSYARALFIVARYHFGTACFRATPIIPGLHIMYVTKEPRLNVLVRYFAFGRYSITYEKVYKLASILTAVDGTNQSETIGNLMSLYFEKLLTKRSFLDFSSVFKSLLFFLLSTNSLSVFTLAAFGTFDYRLALATWVMYLKIVLTFSTVMRFITAISDTFEISKMQSKLGNFSDEELRVGVFLRYFLKDQSSGDADDV